MTPRIGSFWLLIGCVAVSAATASGEPRAEKPCREHPKLAGACFTLRGRMRLANGTPTVRIWPVGTRRLLLVSEGRFVVDGYSNLPEEISRRLSWDADLFADFEVCSFTRPEPGVARLVCVESAKNVSMRKRD